MISLTYLLNLLIFSVLAYEASRDKDPLGPPIAMGLGVIIILNLSSLIATSFF